MAIIVDVDLKVNSQKALETVDTFKRDAEEKIASIGEMQTGFADMMLAEQNVNPFSGFVDSITSANSAILQMKTSLSSLVSSINSGALSNGLTHLFETSYRTIMSSIETYNNEFLTSNTAKPGSKAQKDAEINMKTAEVTGLGAARNMSSLLKILENHETGLSTSQLGNVMPALFSIVRREVDDYTRSTRSTPRLDELSKYISGLDVFQKAATNGVTGYAPSNTQIQALAKAAILGTRSRSIRDNEDILQQAGLKGEDYHFVVDQLPKTKVFENGKMRETEGFAQAYKYYGRPSESMVGQTLSTQRGSQSANKRVYAEYRNLVKNGNQQAIQLGLDVGLIQARNGRYHFTGDASLAQMDTMAGLVAQSVAEAKSSMPYYFIHRNNPEQQEKLIGRQNNIFQDAVELMEVLSGQAGLSPNAYGYVPFGTSRKDIIAKGGALFDFVDTGRKYRKYNAHAPKIATLGGKDQYIVPKTYLDENGNLVWRDPSWRKENGVAEKDDDYFATISNSAFTNMLGMFGNNTYGYGRDDDANPIYKTPKVVRMSTSHLYKQISDKDGTRMIVDPEKQKEADRINRIFARKETIKYGKPGEKQEDYIAAFGDAGSITLIRRGSDTGLDANGNYETDTYNGIVRRFADLGMANPFDNMNTGGLFRHGDYENAAKQIDLSRKKATPGNPYSLFGYNKQPTAALVDFKQLYNYLGIPETDSSMRLNQRIDGVALFDPSVLGVNAQMRSAFVDKFMGQSTNWRKLLMGSGLLRESYLSGKNRGILTISNSDNNIVPGFSNEVDENGNKIKGYSFYMPQIGLDKDSLF